MKWIKVLALIFSFIFVTIFPSKLDDQIQIFVSRKVSIKVNKNSPSYAAFEAVNFKPNLNIKKAAPAQAILLTTDEDELVRAIHPLAKKMILNPISIKKQIEYFTDNKVFQEKMKQVDLDYETELLNTSLWTQKNSSWIDEFKTFYKQAKDTKLNAVNSGPPSIGASYSNPKSVLPLNDRRPSETPLAKNANSNTAVDFASDSRRNLEDVTLPKPISKRILGHFSIKGIPISNEHKVEIRRFEEGTFKEQGKVLDLFESTYEILPTELKGFLVGRVVSRQGHIEGEGVVRLSEATMTSSGFYKGPHIQIVKKTDVRGRAFSSYNLGKSKSLDNPALAILAGGNFKKQVGVSGEIGFDGIARDSVSALRVETKAHLPSQQVIVAGSSFATELIPEGMAQALKAMVSDLRKQNLNDPNLTLILGQALFDGRPVSDVSVKIESDESIEPIYFNEMMLPDVRLKGTSINGYYAFIGAPVGLVTVEGTKIGPAGPVYFSHANTVTSEGTVSIAPLLTTIKSEGVEIKTYDPFTGLPADAQIEIQTVSESIQVEDGLFVSHLPQVARWSLLYSHGTEDSLPAHYSYSDLTDYIYVPVISRKWMNYIFTTNKLNYSRGSNIAIGFSIDEDFKIDVSGLASSPKIIYFDYAGKIVNSGVQGGGYIIYDIPEGVYGNSFGGQPFSKTYTRILPVKQSDIFVYTYKSDGY